MLLGALLRILSPVSRRCGRYLCGEEQGCITRQEETSQFIFWVLLLLWPSLFKQSSEDVEKYLFSLLLAVFQVESAFVHQMNGLSLSPMLTLPCPCAPWEQHANTRWVRALIYHGDCLKGSQPYYWWIAHMASIRNSAEQRVVCHLRLQGTFSLPLKKGSACG